LDDSDHGFDHSGLFHFLGGCLMPRFTFLIVWFVSLGAIAACEKKDGLCANPADPDCKPVLIDAGTTIDAIDATPPPCMDNTGCKTAAPVCDLSGGTGVCVVCTADDHALCKDTAPICGTAHTCQACQSAADCPASGLCLASGACAAETDVAYVDAAGADNTLCTKAMPCTKITSGLATQTAAGTPRPYLKIKGVFDEAVAISRNVMMFADPGASLTRTTTGPVVAVSGTSVVEIDELTITGSHSTGDPGIQASDTTALTLKHVTVSKNKGNGISCSGTSVTVSGSTFAENTSSGISCTSGSVTVSSSTFTKNAGGGLVVDGGSFDITNNFLYDNGDKDSALVGGVFLNPTASPTNRFEFNTVVDNHVKDFITVPSAGVVCDVTGFTAPNNIIARNDIHNDVNRPNANTAGHCMYPTSTIDKSVTGLMFVSPGAATPNYHLQVGSTAIGTAATATTVTKDFDGDDRKSTNNDQGADQFRPPSI
jgi:Right handed beta helix region